MEKEEGVREITISYKTLCSFKYILRDVFIFFFIDEGNEAASKSKYFALKCFTFDVTAAWTVLGAHGP